MEKTYEEALEKLKKERDEKEKVAANFENVKRHFETITKTLHKEKDEMKEQLRTDRGRTGRRGIPEGNRNRNEREEGGRGRGTRGRGQGGRTEIGTVKKDKVRKESTEREVEYEKVTRSDMICQKWIEQGRRCKRYQDKTCRYEHPPMCQETCRDPNCKRLHYGKETEEVSRKNERRRAEIKELMKKEK